MRFKGWLKRRKKIKKWGKIREVEDVEREGSVDWMWRGGRKECELKERGKKRRLGKVIKKDLEKEKRGNEIREGRGINVEEKRMLIGEGGERNIGDENRIDDDLKWGIEVRKELLKEIGIERD